MAFVSFAQNLEDVLLHRALGDIPNGRYIDVGAGDPQVDSVTKSFYDLGWSGINVEPLPDFHERLVKDRGRDVNLALAVSDSEGEARFFTVPGYGELSTTVDWIAREYEEGGRPLEEIRVPTRTLASICAEHVNEEIHFLKVDVEGGELAVLAGADFAEFRPWIILVEAVTFGTTNSTETQWNELLISVGYRFVYFDGLNNFYVSDEKYRELEPMFRVPVNVRDNYILPTGTRAEVSLHRVATSLGIESYSDEHEVIERLHALQTDRIDYENRFAAASAELQTALDSVQGLSRRIVEDAVEIDSFWQRTFERERHIAWQNGELERARIAAIEADQRAHLAAVRRHEVEVRLADERAQVIALLNSRSWRFTMPLRAIRRPGEYLRKLIGR